MSKSQNKTKMARFSQQDFGNRLKQARQSAGYDNQKSVADELHVTIATISKWENGTSSPPLGSLVEMAALYSTTTDYLLTGTETEHVDASRKYGLSNDALNVLRNMNHMLRLHQESTKLTSQLPAPRFRYVHPLGFINALITSSKFCRIAFDFTSHSYDRIYMSAMNVNKKNRMSEEESVIDKDEHEKKWDTEIEKIRESADTYYGYFLDNPTILLRAGEYLLNKKWNELFQSLLSDESIWRNGIADSYSNLDQGVISDDVLDHLSWPNKKENQNEESK